jgi:hypothetical protein
MFYGCCIVKRVRLYTPAAPSVSPLLSLPWILDHEGLLTDTRAQPPRPFPPVTPGGQAGRVPQHASGWLVAHSGLAAITDFPGQCTPRLNARFFEPLQPNISTIEDSHDARIAKALAEIGDQKAPNYSEYARKHKVVCTTLSCRHQGKTTSRREANSEHRQRLTIVQEDALIAHINRLTD